jgi:LmbE family N-acetylglucosaminyl deacetylase
MHYDAQLTAKDSTFTIILSPHFDDAVLSLGGLLAKKEHPTLVATFFTGTPEIATTTHWDTISGFKDSKEAGQVRTKENDDALAMYNLTIRNYSYLEKQYGRDETDLLIQADISRDIQALIAAHADKNVDIYSPAAVYTSDITNPDHELLYRAFIDVARNYPQQRVHFFIYEDFPYIKKFMEHSVKSLQRNLENDTDLLFSKNMISLSAYNVSTKIDSLKKYPSQVKAFSALKEDIIKESQEFTETRCGMDPRSACEVVYEVLRY